MDTLSAPPAKRLCFNTEYQISENTAKQVIRPFNLPQQFPSRSEIKNEPPKGGGGANKLFNFKSVDGKDLGKFEIKIPKTGMKIGKTIMLTKHVPKVEQNGISTVKIELREVKAEVTAEEKMLKLQSQYTTKAKFLPEMEMKPLISEKQKIITSHRPLILKKKVKPQNKVTDPKSAMVNLAKPVVNDIKNVTPITSVPEKVKTNCFPEHGKKIKFYTRTLKKIGPNMQLLPHDSPDAKTIISTIAEPVNSRNGTIKFIHRPIQNATILNGLPIKLDKSLLNGQIKDTGLSQQLTIIEQALNRPTDEQLREKALKALAECKIGNKRDVPMQSNTKSVSDSEMQTDVFSLMVPGEFIVNDLESGNIKRQKVKENLPADEKNSKTVLGKTLNEMLDKFGKENATVDETLRKKEVNLPNRTINQLYWDYMSLKHHDKDGLLGIHQAVLANDRKMVDRLLLVIKMINSPDLDVDMKSLEGATGLELAIEWNVDIEIIKSLLNAGANPGYNSLDHNSAIIEASKKSLPVLKLLLEYTNVSYINTTDGDGMSCLHYCAQNGNAEGVMALLQRDADVNMQDKKSGRTAIFMALENQYEELTTILLSYNADPSIPNFAGQSILPLIDGIKSYAVRAALHKALR